MNSKKDNTGAKVFNFSEAREAKIEDKKRKYERILFKHILGVYCVSEGEGLKAVELIDVSMGGLSFQLPVGSKNLKGLGVGKEMIFRFYFSQETYLPVNVRILNTKECIENGMQYVRFGGEVDTSTQSFEAFRLFVEFLGKYAETAKKDNGDLKFFYF